MWGDKLGHHLWKLKVFQFCFHHVLGLLPNIAGTWRICAWDKYLQQKWSFIFKAICRNMRTWQLFKFPGWKLGSGFKAGGRESLQTDGLWCPHMEGKRPLVPCAARLLGKQGSPDGLRAAPNRSPSCCRAQGHQAPCPGPGGTGTLAGVGPGGSSSSWGTNLSRRAWQGF